jgi:hypothetical protein
MTIAQLTAPPLLYFDLYNLIHAKVLRLYSFQYFGARCEYWAGTASADRHHLAIDDRSAGFIRVADQGAIVERHEEGVGMPAKKRKRSTVYV